ncbi:MAG: hypothetical protein QM775_10355 [Pirellulales bacterium]
MRTIWKLTWAALVFASPAVASEPAAFVESELRPVPQAAAEFAPEEGVDMRLFSDEQLDAAIFPDDYVEETSPFQLVQREEPYGGTTPEEQMLRQRVAGTVGQGPYGQEGYSTYQPSYSAGNSLLPGYGGYGFGGFNGVFNTRKRWYFSLSQTADYVTNLALPLSLTPLNAPVRRNDAQFQTNVFAQYRIWGDQDQSLTTAFNFYQSLHPRVEQLDLTGYTSLTQYTARLTDRLLAYSYVSFTHYVLDHNPFLNQGNVGGGIAFQRNQYVNWVFNNSFSKNDYRIDPTQDSRTSVFQLQRYRYFGDLTQYWFGGYAYGYNDADNAAWSYDLHNVFLGLGKNFGSQNRNQALVYGTYGLYDFQGVDLFQVPPTVRQDNIYTLTTRLSRTIGPHAMIFAQYTYFSSDSNVDRQNFESHLISLGGLLAW